jgi:hypothetical protein
MKNWMKVIIKGTHLLSRAQWLTPVILSTQEAMIIRRIMDYYQEDYKSAQANRA